MDKTPIERVRSIGGMGLDYLGMPPYCATGGYFSIDPDLHRTMWSRRGAQPDPDHEPKYSRASLHAELLTLEALGFIEIVDLRMNESGYDLVDVDFRYTERGALEVLDAWNATYPESQR